MLNFFKPRPKKADTLSLIAQSCQLTAEFMTSQISKDVYDKLLLAAANDFIEKFGS